ncbi:hypothetical protein NSB25_18865 [Acetatifactor muris]|uniref:DUF927 domain-containing protein n=1 Tax=Acetatifactor muris TaxID=879566 RepID=A0A2K4ZLB9_9FIRM|nr:hypothetical protein [Acetatifactor muris]MCR2049330.1 hypothetical protein [Acetatifactor muris]SOY31278.1 hypothetical protein AMURIS_04014 [Acetatifactor muris]
MDENENVQQEKFGFKPICRPTPEQNTRSETQSAKNETQDARNKASYPTLKQQYQRVASEIQGNTSILPEHVELLNYVLQHYARHDAELCVLKHNNNASFMIDKDPFTNFGAIPLKVIIRHSREQPQVFIELLILGRDTAPKIICLEAQKLNSGRWIDEMGFEYSYLKGGEKLLKALIRAMARFAPTEDIYEYSGWMQDDEDAYIFDGQKLTGREQDLFNAKSHCKHALEMLNVAPHTTTIPLLATELLSLIHSRMVENGIYFKGIICLLAPTQSFKTTIATLFFDHVHGRKADLNFEATSAAFDRVVGNTCDKTVIVDDLKPGATKTESRNMLLKLSKLIRMCSDDSGGIQKANAKNGTVENIARCLAVATAEQIQIEVQSTLARLLILEMERNHVDIDKLAYFQDSHSEYQAFIRDYIMDISCHGLDAYCRKIAGRFLQERNVLRKDSLKQDILVDNRTNDMCVWLYLSFSEFLSYARRIDAIDEKQQKDYLAESLSIFHKLMMRQTERVSELDDIKLFFNGLQYLLDTKEVKIPQLQARNSDYIADNDDSTIGFTKTGFVYLKNNIALQKVASYYHRFGREFTINETVLRKKLANSNYILPESRGTYIHRLNVCGRRYQCIKFEANTFSKLLSGGKTYDSEKESPSDRSLRRNAENIFGRGNATN